VAPRGPRFGYPRRRMRVRPRPSITAVCLSTAALLAGGCSLAAMREDLALQATNARLAGSVEVIAPTGAPVLVAVLDGERSPGGPLHVIDYVLVHGERESWAFLVPPGTYRVVAFEDANGDVQYQADERVTSWSGFEALTVEPGASREGLALRIVDGLPPGEVAPSVVGPTGAERSLYVGNVLPLSDPRFARENGVMGMEEPQRFMVEVGAGLFLTEPHDPARTPVVFIHGISGYPREFEALVAGLDRARFQVWLAQYPSGFDLDLVADYVSRALDELVQLHDPARLCVVAHSMGGVVMRRALGRYGAIPTRARVPLFVSLASPLGGHPGAAMGAAMSPVVLPVWRSLVPSGHFMATLFEAPLPGETRRALFFAFGSDDARGDGVVPLVSQLRPEAQAEAAVVRGFATSHTGILSDASSRAAVHAELAEHCR
jgi:hypothetical protein